MHATVEQLLSLRDGERIDAGLHEHVAGCDECSASLARLESTAKRLRALPGLEPPPAAWQAIERRVARKRRRWPLPVAAAAAVAIAALALWRAEPVPQSRQPATPAPATAAADVPRPVDDLRAESRRLERMLHSLDAHAPRVMDARTAGAIAGLEDGIAMIDYGLMRGDVADNQASRQLWNRRVALMNTLVQVRGAQLQTVVNRGDER